MSASTLANPLARPARLAVARLCAGGCHRHELTDWLLAAERWCAANPAIDGIAHIKLPGELAIGGAPVARNRIVRTARELGCDLVFMLDDDMEPAEGFFEAAVMFLLPLQRQGKAAVLGSPYCMAPPEERVCVHHWETRESHSPSVAWKIAHIPREDAARRSGIEQVANIGTGCVAYTAACFDLVPAPYFDYTYSADHCEVIETEDCYLHRRLVMRGGEVFCAWDHWAAHHKAKRVGKPVAIYDSNVRAVFMEQARAELRAEMSKYGMPLEAIREAEAENPDLPLRGSFEPTVSLNGGRHS